MNANQINCYNCFVDLINKNKIKLTNIKVEKDNGKSLYFTIDSESGFTEEEANFYFSDFIEKFNTAGISYNKRGPRSELEKELIDKSETVLNVGFGTIELNKIKCKEPNNINNGNKTYLMHDTANCFYKIGKSIKPKYREKTLQSEKPTVELIHIIDKDIERKLHNKFKDKRIRGEWFNLNRDDVNYIKSL